MLTCCSSLIVSPCGLVRNVPLRSWPWRSRGEEDDDESARVEPSGSAVAGEGGHTEAGDRGRDVGRELPANQAPVATVSRRRGESAAASGRRQAVQPWDRRART